MASEFHNKTALITGAASGIGAATTRYLAERGARLILIDREPSDTSDYDDACAITLDVTDEAGWAAIDLPALDLVVVNAGISGASPIAALDFAEWRRILAVNLDGVFLTLRAAMRAINNGGSIVVTSSVSAIKAEPGVAAYAASKAGAIQLAKVAAKEGAPRGIRVNAIAPGGVETPIWHGMPFFDEFVAEKGEAAAFAEMAAMATPLGRFATADEIAAQIGFLLSEAAATITGAVLTSDGGYSL